MKKKTIKLSPDIQKKHERAISQAAANIALENMHPSAQAIADAEAVARGEKTNEQVIQETIRRYRK